MEERKLGDINWYGRLEVISIGKWKREIRLSFYGLSCLFVCYYSHLFFAVYWFTGGAPEILSLFLFFSFLFFSFSFFVFFTSLHHLKLSSLALAIFNHHLDR